ncbi:probable potassium transporter 17 [Dioscorea cayenensis subsp. rotundata]|uniref:Potassium transporter n=1 Tax=Dioscorea cayennensis subsp. rotundata TaxID=55577 RepID=A0AB40D4L5_DIOCR|nr:probable potassium transporter 17 [Dioscorea cayenensis subsp. rotundata]
MDLELGMVSKKNRRWNDVVLAYKTLGVVFGGLVTSPLYVYPSMNLKSPTEEDYLGIYSIIFWTLTLIGVVKYVCIALNADDHGEGGTFALYSLLCRHANVGILPSRDTDSKTNNLNAEQSSSGIKQSRLQKFIEQSMTARRILLLVAILGMCMLIGDGILTPAISVLSAMDGLRGPLPSIGKSAVEGSSAGVLIALFLLQKYGTSKVSFLFSPIMAAWTFTTPIIGVYSFLRYYPSIFKAISPHYIVNFFLRKGKTGWQLLGGTVLCITGAEAMFADLGHFNKKSIQMAFIFTIYPSLVLTYAGQTAYLTKNLNDHRDGFYKFVPGPVYWPMFVIATSAAVVASQSLISATFSVIKQSVALDYFPRVKIVHTSAIKEGEVYSPETNYILMILCVTAILGFGDGQDMGNAFGVVVILVMFITTILLTLVMIIVWRIPILVAGLYFIPFFIMEGVYVSAVCTKIVEGGWFPFVISIILASIMFGWYYGRQKKLDYEMTNKITVESLGGLISSSETERVPGLCLFYTNVQDGFTPILGHYIKNLHSFHKVTIFTTFRYLLAAKVDPNERIIVRKFGLTGIYGCIIQYGYADFHSPAADELVNQIISSLKTYISNNSNGLLPTLVDEEILQLEEAKSTSVVYVKGKTRFQTGKETGWFDRIILGFYEFLHRNCRSAVPNIGIPLQQNIEIGMLYKA